MKRILSLGVIALLFGITLGTPLSRAAEAGPQASLDPQSAALLKQTLDVLGTMVAQMQLQVKNGNSSINPAAATAALNSIKASLTGINALLAARNVALVQPAQIAAQPAPAAQSKSAEEMQLSQPIVASDETAEAAGESALAPAGNETQPQNQLATTASGSQVDFRKLGWLLPIVIVLGAVLFLRQRGKKEELAVEETPPSTQAAAAERGIYPEAY